MARRLDVVDNQDGTFTVNAVFDTDILFSDDNPGEVTILNANTQNINSFSYLLTHTYHTAESRRRLLQDILVTLLGSSNVYFQPPPGLKMLYPCIVYSRDDIHTSYADNIIYKSKKRYKITVIDRNPDSEIPDKVGALPLCAFDRFFTADNLNHDVYTLYF